MKNTGYCKSQNTKETRFEWNIFRYRLNIFCTSYASWNSILSYITFRSKFIILALAFSKSIIIIIKVKNAYSLWGIHAFNVPIHKIKEFKTLHVRLKWKVCPNLHFCKLRHIIRYMYVICGAMTVSMTKKLMKLQIGDDIAKP